LVKFKAFFVYKYSGAISRCSCSGIIAHPAFYCTRERTKQAVEYDLSPPDSDLADWAAAPDSSAAWLLAGYSPSFLLHTQARTNTCTHNYVTNH